MDVALIPRLNYRRSLKAHLVAKGFHQTTSIDYNETFSPVVKPATVRTILSLPLSNNWIVRQCDFNNSFLNGDLLKNIYMEQPKGFVNVQTPHYVCKLTKAL